MCRNKRRRFAGSRGSLSGIQSTLGVGTNSGSSVAENIMSTNNKVAPFDNKLVRQAIAHAIDRKAIIDLVMAGYGTPIGSHWPPITPYY